MEKFKLAKFKFDTAAQEKIILPPYKGSTFRGGFGYIFKKIVCVNKGQDCQDCLLREKCLYISIFETPPPEGTQIMRKYTSIPRPFVIEPPLDSKREYSQGEKLNFSLILIGKAIQYLPYFIFTFQELGKKGIGKGRRKYNLEKVDSLGLTQKSTIYKAEDNLLRDSYHLITSNDLEKVHSHLSQGRLALKSSTPFDFPSSSLSQNRLTLKFITPTRIKYEGRLTKDPEFHILMRNLLRRISLLSYFHCDEEFKKEEIRLLIDKAKKIKIENQNLKWYDWERYSSRQDRRMKLGGFVGEITYKRENLKEFLPCILLGSFTHVGKGATFGLGKYKIVNI